MNFKECCLVLVALLTSSSTLLCCALPVLFTLLGAGSVLASWLGAAPWLVALSENKVYLFSASGIALFISGVLVYQPIKSCPTDPKMKAMCLKVKKVNFYIWSSSVVLWTLGFCVAYLALPIRIMLDI